MDCLNGMLQIGVQVDDDGCMECLLASHVDDTRINFEIIRKVEGRRLFRFLLPFFRHTVTSQARNDSISGYIT